MLLGVFQWVQLCSLCVEPEAQMTHEGSIPCIFPLCYLQKKLLFPSAKILAGSKYA